MILLVQILLLEDGFPLLFLLSEARVLLLEADHLLGLNNARLFLGRAPSRGLLEVSRVRLVVLQEVIGSRLILLRPYGLLFVWHEHALIILHVLRPHVHLQRDLAGFGLAVQEVLRTAFEWSVAVLWLAQRRLDLNSADDPKRVLVIHTRRCMLLLHFLITGLPTGYVGKLKTKVPFSPMS